MVRTTGAVLCGPRLAACWRNAWTVQTKPSAIRHHLAQTFSDFGERGRLQVDLGATGGIGPVQPLIRKVGCDQPATVGEHRIRPGQLQGGDLNHRLTDGRTRHVLRNPWGRTGLRPAATGRGPVFITHQTDTFLPADLNA